MRALQLPTCRAGPLCVANSAHAELCRFKVAGRSADDIVPSSASLPRAERIIRANMWLVKSRTLAQTSKTQHS
eukprot:4945024-Alexandrium_andersonii.AAC.2